MRAKLREKIADWTITFFIFLLPFLVFLTLANAVYDILTRTQTIVYAKEITTEVKNTTLAIITAYTSSEDETDDRPWETASGERAERGTIACPSRLDFGTRVRIQGIEYVCNDRMNIRYRDKDHFDIWVASKNEAFAWGKREIEVEIL